MATTAGCGPDRWRRTWIPDANAIFFLTNAQAAKDKEIDLNDNVCLVFSDIRKQHYVSLTGRAELSDDRAKIKQLWSSLDSAFWSDENDPSIRVLKITPTIAEYWDRGGAIVSTVEMVKAALTKTLPNRAKLVQFPAIPICHRRIETSIG